MSHNSTSAFLAKCNLKFVAFAAFAFMSLNSAVAYEPDRARVNFAHEMAECAAYFMFVSAAPELDAPIVSGLRDRFNLLMEFSATLSTPELAAARAQLAGKTIAREMQGSWENMSIINNKYGYTCIDIVANPEVRMQYWLDKTD